MLDPPVGEWADLYEPFRDPRAPCQQGKILPPQTLRRARAGYYGHLAHIDQQVHPLLEHLNLAGIAESTFVCFVSAHDEEMLGDHHLFAKALSFEGSARIPLFLRSPNGSIKPGVRIKQPVELRDVMPTLWECAGLAIPSTVEGKSILPLARGETGGWREYIHEEHVPNVQAPGLGSSHYIVNSQYQYIWYSRNGQEQLFDLVSDPTECNDLAGKAAYRDRIPGYRRRLAEELDGREEGFVEHGRLVTGRPVGPTLTQALPNTMIS